MEQQLAEFDDSTVRLLKADVLHQAFIGQPQSDRGNIERYGFIMALKAYIDRSQAAGITPATLVRLVAALEDLDRGRVHPALRPRKRSRKDTGPRSRLESTLRGHLAGVVEGLMGRAGMAELEAAHWVQRRLSASGVQMKAEQLVEWRKQARAPKRDAFMRRAFHKVLIEDWSEPEARAERLIENVLKLA